ncbi:MAG: Bug family tripartite tricarboxylate transporter substrate binding protein [Geminicoccaceae bacterium]
MRTTRRPVAAAVLLGALIVTPAAAAWPEDRSIQVVVPFPPGGGVDQMARLLLPHVERHLPGAHFVVDNRGGAGGQIGSEVAFNAAPDGYTLGAVTSPALMTIAIERPVRYRVAEFSYIANVVDDPGGIWVAAASPYKSLQDLLTAARQEPETVTLGTTGIGSDDHLLQLNLEQAAQGVRFIHVPFAGSAPMQTALLGGHLDVGSFNMSEGLAGLHDGRFRALAQTGDERWAPAGDVPTFRELGLNLVGGAQRGIVGPPGLPEPVRRRLVEAFGLALADPQFVAEAERVDLPVRVVLGNEYRNTVMQSEARLRELWQKRPWRDQ